MPSDEQKSLPPKDGLRRDQWTKDWGTRSIPWFREVIAAMKVWLSDFEEPVPEREGRKIPVIYSTPDRAVAKYLAPTAGGLPDLPLFAFTTTGADIDMSRYLPPYVEFNRKKIDDEWFIFKKPLPVNISFNVTLLANHQVTLDSITWAIMARFATLDSWLNVYGVPTKLNFEGFTDNRDLEPGQETRLLRYEYSFMAEAWMPLPYEIVPQIGKILITVNEELSKDELCSITVKTQDNT